LLQQISLGGIMIALPIFLQMVLEYNAFQAGLTLTPMSLSMFFVALIVGKRAGRRRPSRIIQAGFALAALATLALIFVVPRADSGWWMVLPMVVLGTGTGLPRFAAQQLHAVADRGGACQRSSQCQLGGRLDSGCHLAWPLPAR
jgi:MFS family permease